MSAPSFHFADDTKLDGNVDHLERKEGSAEGSGQARSMAQFVKCSKVVFQVLCFGHNNLVQHFKLGEQWLGSCLTWKNLEC